MSPSSERRGKRSQRTMTGNKQWKRLSIEEEEVKIIFSLFFSFFKFFSQFAWWSLSSLLSLLCFWIDSIFLRHHHLISCNVTAQIQEKKKPGSIKGSTQRDIFDFCFCVIFQNLKKSLSWLLICICLSSLRGRCSIWSSCTTRLFLFQDLSFYLEEP